VTGAQFAQFMESPAMLSGLLIRSPYIDWILAGSKTWEIRGSSTAKRGRIALIQSGSGTVIGVADLVDAVGPLTLRGTCRQCPLDVSRPKVTGAYGH
jgi:hypothetical protein